MDHSEQLLDLHRRSLEAHVNGDWRFFRDLAADPILSLRDGDVLSASPQETGERFRSYLSQAEFSRYEDIAEPRVWVSDDGTLGWVIARVRVEGVFARGTPDEQSLDTTWSWVAMFERDDAGEWRLAGTSSTRTESAPD